MYISHFRLSLSPLQLAAGTVLLVDETALQVVGLYLFVHMSAFIDIIWIQFTTFYSSLVLFLDFIIFGFS
jgi:hypothetical protein